MSLKIDESWSGQTVIWKYTPAIEKMASIKLANDFIRVALTEIALGWVSQVNWKIRWLSTNALSSDICPSNRIISLAEPKQTMKIAQVAPLWERVPPPTYGGIELVVSRLTDELVRRGHDVTLFASGDSQTLAKLEAVYPRALRLDPEVKEYAAYEMLELSQVYQIAKEFDIIHSHVGITALPLASFVQTPTVHTVHSSFTPDNTNIYTHHKQQAYVSISNAQREINLNYVGTVYNGIELADYPAMPSD